MTNDNSSQYPPPHRPGGRFFDSIRSSGMRRTIDGRWIGGVAGAIADRTGIDRTLIRGLAVVLCLFFGIGVLLYGLAWLFLPEPDGRIHAEGVLHGVWSGGFIGSCLVVLLGLGNPGIHAPWLFWPVGHDFWGWFGPVLGIGIVVAVVVYAVNHRGDRHDLHDSGRRGPASGGPAAGPGGSSGPAGGPGGPAGGAGGPGGPAGYGAGTYGGGPVQERPVQDGPVDDAQTRPMEDTGQPEADARLDDEPVQPPSGDAATVALPAPDDRGAVPDYRQMVPDYRDAEPETAYQPMAADVRYMPDAPPAASQAPPPRMITKPAGGPLTLLFAGLAIVAVAAGWLVEREFGLPGNGRLIAVGLGLAVLGIGVVVAGAWGRRGGGLTGWAWIGLVLALIVAVVPAVGRVAAVQDSTWTPATARVAEHGYSVGIGSTTVDLRELNVPASGVTNVPVNSGIGDITVLLPPDETAKVQMIGAGEWHRGSADRSNGFRSGSADDSSDFGKHAVKRTTKYGNGPAHLVVKIRMGVGNVSVEQAGQGANS